MPREPLAPGYNRLLVHVAEILDSCDGRQYQLSEDAESKAARLLLGMGAVCH